MPEPPVEPTPWLPRESFLAAPLLAQDASYLAASARISSLRVRSMSCLGGYVCGGGGSGGKMEEVWPNLGWRCAFGERWSGRGNGESEP